MRTKTMARGGNGKPKTRKETHLERQARKAGYAQAEIIVKRYLLPVLILLPCMLIAHLVLKYGLLGTSVQNPISKSQNNMTQSEYLKAAAGTGFPGMQGNQPDAFEPQGNENRASASMTPEEQEEYLKLFSQHLNKLNPEDLGSKMQNEEAAPKANEEPVAS
jgi:hypothetical protein